MNRQDETNVNGTTHTTRRAFCTDLMLTSTGLVLAAATTTKILAAQDSMVAYPPRKIENAETVLPGSGLYFNYPTRNDPAVLLRSSEGEYRAYSRRFCNYYIYFSDIGLWNKQIFTRDILGIINTSNKR
jgi:hypothetical protein